MDKTVKETDALSKILQTLFARLPVSVEIKGRSYPIKVVGIKDGLYLLVSVPGKSEGEKTRILFLTHNNHFFHGVFTVTQRNPSNGMELLRVQAVKVSEAQRSQGRVDLDGQNSEPIILTNIINQLHLRRSLGFVDKGVETILQKHAKKMKETYPDSLVYFSDRMDNRLRIMYNFEQSIFITNRLDRSSGGSGSDFVPVEEYLKLISLNKVESRFISEISVLIRYKNYTPLGYVQVLSDRSLDTEDYNKITLFAAAISRDVIASGFFQESKEKCQAEDISRNGLGFFHPQSIFFSRSFAVGEVLLFDLQLNGELKGTFRAAIRNITNTDKMFRIGCQFFNLNEREEQILTQFMDARLGPGEGAQAPETSIESSEPIAHSEPQEAIQEEIPDMGFGEDVGGEEETG
ncbi:PilZ domain-containing protein [Leptospira wolffii]|uniref:PilZ domain-containing protein n=1 Tax=Leptospira wolffii TaxID=409998 RepID=A0ABV5BM41_9LEPT|nr:PilZ domain-containing protein [Leptospira wolffii]EPG68132.1 type IV pilus assembly protein PilZ [Leptospira wolffii serovar Khorat str. Khorat-H2]TGL46605.1 PilZ domain-containing protein [Leptospira wolffii]